MSKKPKRNWRLTILFAAMLASMMVGLIFRVLGKNLLPWNSPANISFLWISITVFSIAVIVSYTTLPLAKTEIEAMRKNPPTGKATSSFWYNDFNTMRMVWLCFGVFFPGMCIMEILQILAITSNLDIFWWLGAVVFLVVMVADIVVLVLIFKGARQRANKRTPQRQ